MKILPFLSPINALSYANMVQINMGNPMVVDDTLAIQGYQLINQYALSVGNGKALVVYQGLTNDKLFDYFINITDLYNIVKRYFGSNFNENTLKTHMGEFANVFSVKDKYAVLSQSIRYLEDEFIRVSRYHPKSFNSDEDFTMALIGFIHGHARNLYKDVYNLQGLNYNDKLKIGEVLNSISFIFSE